MEKLKQSPVCFSEETHTYTYKGFLLSGITSIINRYLFPDMYGDVSIEILQRAQDKGKRIHNNIQMYLSGMPYDESEVEIHAFIEALKERSTLEVIDSEYIVSDNETVASAIDIVAKCFGGYMLYDIKTTSVLHTEYLQWQLSIYAYLFEKQTGYVADGLYAIHLRGDQCEFVQIQRLPDEYVVALLDAYRTGAEQFDNPLHQMPVDFDDLLRGYADVCLALQEVEAAKKPLEEQKKRFEENVAEMLRDKGLSKLETEVAKITVGKDSQRQTFDYKAFSQSDAFKEAPETFAPFVRTTTTKGRITITLK